MTYLTQQFNQKQFNNTCGIHSTTFFTAKPIKIENPKRPDLKRELQGGSVVAYIDGIGFSTGNLQGRGFNRYEGAYEYTFSL